LIKTMNTGSEVGKKLLLDIRLVWHSGGVAESELETFLC
jgi:hypothetical protein